MDNLQDYTVVFDLDDTLYAENDYVISGISFLEEFVYKVYKIRLEGKLLDAYGNGNKDFLDIACKSLKIPENSKESLLWAYRLHHPNIKLSDEIEETLSLLKKKKAKIIILTDGRSITQRLKINALGLNHLPKYISEDFNSEKPSKKRFIQIEKDFPSKKYVYIADNPKKDFIAPEYMNWICICANWVKNKIHKVNKFDMPSIKLDSPKEITGILLNYK